MYNCSYKVKYKHLSQPSNTYLRGTTASITVCSDGSVARIDLRIQKFLSYTECFLNTVLSTFTENINGSQDWKTPLRLENTIVHCQTYLSPLRETIFILPPGFSFCSMQVRRQKLQNHRVQTSAFQTHSYDLGKVSLVYSAYLGHTALNVWVEKGQSISMPLTNLNKNLYLLSCLPLSFQTLQNFV